MKRTFAAVLVFLVSICWIGCQKEPKATAVKLETEKDRQSYAIGVNTGSSLMMVKDEIDPNLVKEGLQDQLSGKPLLIKEEEVHSSIRKLTKKIMDKRKQEQSVEAAENLAAGQKFLAENKNKPGVVTTPSGLQYIVLKQGDGPKPEATSKVKVNYRGTTIDGTEFDSSYKRGKPSEFMASRVIKGWTEGLQLMNVGSKYKFFIPAELAYGKRGAGAKIPPNSTLIFEVELLDIVK